MSELCVGKINVLKIDKEKLFKGAKGTYLDIVLIPTPNNEHGDDWMIVQGVSKEDKERGIKGAILGNAKKIRKAASQSRPPERETPPDLDDEVPF